MRCEEIRELLVAHADGELDDVERERVDSHLANCPACRRERAAFESTGNLLSLLGPVPGAGRSISARVMATVRGEDPWCGHIRRELTAFVDGELTEAEARPVREHLATCAACAAESRALERTGDALRAWKLPSMRIGLARLFAPPRARGRLLRFAAALAAACLLLAVGIAFFVSESGTATPPPGLLRAMEMLDPATLEILDQDPGLLEIVRDLELLESVTDEEVALLTLNGSGG
ncbi:MAG: zf-HC2 domain-containing protein [Planctomycetes bacterium]|jgi:anti-sigma factor RsiW|nr:zf-HC2 domain-containing protein [Planctomycetota bacterium]